MTSFVPVVLARQLLFYTVLLSHLFRLCLLYLCVITLFYLVGELRYMCILIVAKMMMMIIIKILFHPVAYVNTNLTWN